MYGEGILGLTEVITEPKLLYQQQIYSACNFNCKGEHTVSLQRPVPLQLDWMPS